MPYLAIMKITGNGLLTKIIILFQAEPPFDNVFALDFFSIKAALKIQNQRVKTILFKLH